METNFVLCFFTFGSLFERFHFFPHNSVCGLSLLRLKEYGVAEVTVFFGKSTPNFLSEESFYWDFFLLWKWKSRWWNCFGRCITLDFSVCCSFFFACLVSFFWFSSFFLFHKIHFFSLFSFVLRAQCVNTIRRHSSPFEKLLWNALASAYSANVNSVRFNSMGISRAYVSQRMLVCVCWCIAAFFFFPSLSFTFHSRSLSLSPRCECESEYMWVYVSFQRYTEMRMQSPYMLQRMYGWTGQSKSNSKSKSERVCERCYMPPAYIFHLCLSLHISIYHTYTPTHACTHSLTHSPTDSEIAEQTSHNVCVLCSCNRFFDMHG